MSDNYVIPPNLQPIVHEEYEVEDDDYRNFWGTGFITKPQTTKPLEPKTDAIDHPAHYTFAGETYEAIRVIEAWALGYCLGNAIKYIARAEHKGFRLDDLKKARWYLDREIGRREGGD